MGVSYTKLASVVAVAAVVGAVIFHQPVNAAPDLLGLAQLATIKCQPLVTGKKVQCQQKVLSWCLSVLWVVRKTSRTI